MALSQNFWNDPAYIANLRKLWKQPSSIASRSIIGQLAGITTQEHGFDQKGNTVLDVGCGAGRMSELFKDAHYKGCDSSQGMVNLCQSNGLDVKIGSVYNIPEPDKSVDLAICHAVLFHVASVNEGIKELWRVTKGRLIYSLYYVPLFTRVKTPPFIKFQFNHKGAVPTWSEDMDRGLGWWSVQNIVPCWQVGRFIEKYIKPTRYTLHWFKHIECCEDKIVFCVLDR